MPVDQPIAYTVDGRPLFDNTPTVVSVVMLDTENRLITVRRANNPGRGLLGLPAGFQMRGESWQECGARETLEETGIVIVPRRLVLRALFTDEYSNNVVIAFYPYAINQEASPQDGEALEIVKMSLDQMKIEEWAFPFHFLEARLAMRSVK